LRIGVVVGVVVFVVLILLNVVVHHIVFESKLLRLLFGHPGRDEVQSGVVRVVHQDLFVVAVFELLQVLVRVWVNRLSVRSVVLTHTSSFTPRIYSTTSSTSASSSTLSTSFLRIIIISIIVKLSVKIPIIK